MNNIIEALKGLGFTTINEDWYQHVDDWRSWYKGNVAKFHNYRVWTGHKYVNCQRYSLGMAKKICEDWANLLMNEKVKITLEGEKEQEFIDAVFTANDFEINMNELQEKGAALGTYALVPRMTKVAVNEAGEIVGNGQIVLDYITADHIFPLSWVGRDIKECAFASVINSNGKNYLYIQMHTIVNGTYQILNVIYAISNGQLAPAKFTEIKGWENVSDKPILTGSSEPQFVIGRYNITNNVEENNPMGIAVYANAIDVIKGIDITYDSYVNEFLLGKKRVMVKPSATNWIDGEEVFDENDCVFYVLPEDVTDGTIIKEIDMTLRTDEHTQGLQDQLNLLSAKCGFGEQHYKFDSGNVSTATQIISENSDMFRTIKKHEIVLESLLTELCRILLRMGNQYLSAGLDDAVEISIDFDDSIIIDKAQEEARIYQMLDAGLMRADEARSLLMNEDIETARKALPGMEELTTEGQDDVE